MKKKNTKKIKGINLSGKNAWLSPPGTFHFLIGKFSYFVIRFLYLTFLSLTFPILLLGSSIVKSNNEIGIVPCKMEYFCLTMPITLSTWILTAAKRLVSSMSTDSSWFLPFVNAGILSSPCCRPIESCNQSHGVFEIVNLRASPRHKYAKNTC